MTENYLSDRSNIPEITSIQDLEMLFCNTTYCILLNVTEKQVRVLIEIGTIITEQVNIIFKPTLNTSEILFK